MVVLADGVELRQYWMHLEVKPQATLDSLDRFLRATWLECCGHMSAFYVGRAQAGKTRRIAELEGVELRYVYDFGSSTELRLRIAGERLASNDGRDAVRLGVRNVEPSHPCACGEKAAVLCAECQWSGPSAFCSACAEEHDCGEEMLLPFVNSPRVGTCGYAGPA